MLPAPVGTRAAPERRRRPRQRRRSAYAGAALVFAVEELPQNQVIGVAVVVSVLFVACLWNFFRRDSKKPPFSWSVMAHEYEAEFMILGKDSEIVEKWGDYGQPGWVIPINGTARMVEGNKYNWALIIDKKCPERP